MLIALLAQVTIPLPFTPVPITGQTYGVLFVGAVLGSRRGLLSMLLYVAEGCVGLPFFAGGASGWTELVGATGGYLVGFMLAAYVVGRLAERGWDRRINGSLTSMLVGQIIIYALGIGWLAMYVGADKAVQLGLLPFVAGDVLKLLLASATLPLGWKLLGKR